MIGKDEAKRLVERHLTTLHIFYAPNEPASLVVLDEATMEEDFGWIFFYDSKLYVESGDWRYAVYGNSPIIVNKHDASLHVTGTGRPIEFYIENYRSTGDARGKRTG